MASAARYWMVNMTSGPSGYLEVGPGSDRETVRAWLANWLRELRPSLVEPGPSRGTSAALWLALDAADDTLTVSGYGFGAGPPGSLAIPPEALVDAAIADLSAAA